MANTISRGLRIMPTLLAKDWRVYRLQMIALLVVAGACYLVPALAGAHGLREDGRRLLYAGSTAAAYLTGLLAAAFGGPAIAGERGDTTSDFIGMMPVSRGQIMASKCTISILAITFFAATHFAIGLKIEPPGSGFYRDADRYWENARGLWCMCLGGTTCLFGVSWLLSTMTRSAVVSSLTSILVTVGTMVLILGLVSTRRTGLKWDERYVAAATTLCIGVFGLIVGTVHYLRRIEP
jgi:hypothetical protein